MSVLDRPAGAAGVVRGDLEYILENAGKELESIAGSSLLVTGGAGFLGYYFVQAALAWNELAAPANRIRVVVADNYARGVPDWLEGLDGTDELEVVVHDVREPLPAEVGHVEWVVHAAGIASPTYYRRHPLETMDANVGGLRLLLDRYASGGGNGALRGFLFMSSSEIYGDPAPESIPTAETYRGNVSCTGPRACYDESKRFGETLCVTFAQVHGLPVTVARPFNNYGPGLKLSDRRVIPDLARDVLEGRDVTLLSDGAATRTFCYAADAVVGYYKILVNGEAGESYNVGIERPEISMRGLAELVVDIARDELGYEGRVVHAESDDPVYLVDNPNRRCPDLAKAKSELGFDPRIEIEEGIRRSLVWYRDNRQGADA
jgi:dTDP-glucose 4,6-dehydratase/UDP-glucuronate decarboxylase